MQVIRPGVWRMCGWTEHVRKPGFPGAWRTISARSGPRAGRLRDRHATALQIEDLKYLAFRNGIRDISFLRRTVKGRRLIVAALFDHIQRKF